MGEFKQKTPEVTAEENKAVDSAIIKTIKPKMDYFIKTHDNFYLYVYEALKKADAQNMTEFITGQDVNVLNYATHPKI